MDILNWVLDSRRQINESYKVDISNVGSYMLDNYDEYTDDAKTSCVYTFINYISSIYYNNIYMRNNDTSISVSVNDDDTNNGTIVFHVSLDPPSNNQYFYKVLDKENKVDFIKFEEPGEYIRCVVDCSKPNSAYESVKYGLIVKDKFRSINEGIKGNGVNLFGTINNILFDVSNNKQSTYFEPLNESVDVSHYDMEALKNLSNNKRQLQKIINKITPSDTGVIDPLVRLVLYIDDGISKHELGDSIASYKMVMRHKNKHHWAVDVRLKLNNPISKIDAPFLSKVRSSSIRSSSINSWTDGSIDLRVNVNVLMDKVSTINDTKNTTKIQHDVAIKIKNIISSSTDPDIATMRIKLSKPDTKGNVNVTAYTSSDGVINRLDTTKSKKTRSIIIATINGNNVEYLVDLNRDMVNGFDTSKLSSTIASMVKKEYKMLSTKMANDILKLVESYNVVGIKSAPGNTATIKNVIIIVSGDNIVIKPKLEGINVRSTKYMGNGTSNINISINLSHYTGEPMINSDTLSNANINMSNFTNGIPKSFAMDRSEEVIKLGQEVKSIVSSVISHSAKKIDKRLKAKIYTKHSNDGHFDLVVEYITEKRSKITRHESMILFNNTVTSIIGGKIDNSVIRPHSVTTNTKFSLGIMSPSYPDDKGFRSITVIPVNYIDSNFFESLMAEDNANRMIIMVESLVTARRYSGTLGDTPEEKIVKDISRSGIKVKKNATKKEKLEVRRRASGGKYVVDKARRIIRQFDKNKLDKSINQGHIDDIRKLLSEVNESDNDRSKKSAVNKLWKAIINLPIYESIYESKIKNSLNLTGIQSADEAANYAFASFTEYARVTKSYDEDISEIGIKNTNGLPVYADDKMGIIYITFIPRIKFESVRLAKSWYESKEMGGIKVLDVYEEAGEIHVSILINVSKAFTWATGGYNGSQEMYESVKNYMSKYENLGVDSDLTSRLICEHVVINTGVIDYKPIIGMEGSDIVLMVESDSCFTTNNDNFIKFKIPMNEVIESVINN